MRIFFTLYVILALNFNIAFAAPSFSIEPQKDFYFVDDNIEFRLLYDGNDYLSDIFWRNSENDNWQKIVRISPDVYYFVGKKSDINIIDYCPSNSDKFLSYDREPNFNIFLNNKTLGIDVLFVEDGQYNIMLYDVRGSLVRIIAEGRFNHGEQNFYEHIDDFANGIYFVVIETPSGEIKVKNFMY